MPEADDKSQIRGLTRAVNSLTISVAGILCLIGAIAATAHVVTGYVVEAQQASAVVVNVSGRQRMLSQRIALLARRYLLTSATEDRQHLVDAIDLFERSHRALTNGDPELGLPSELPERVRAVYFGSKLGLDQRVARFVTLARRVANDEQEREGLTQALSRLAMGAIDDERSLLYALNAAVDAFTEHHNAQIDQLRRAQLVALGVFLLVLVVSAYLFVRPMLNRVTTIADDLDHLTVTDAMTDVLNRRGFFMEGQRAFEQAQRGAVFVLDIDHFKQVNDIYGHAAGDACIRHVAQIAKEVFRSDDVFGRIGGEEYAAVLSDVSLDGALLVAERLRAAVEHSPCQVAGVTRGTDMVSMTVSIGVEAWGDGPTSLEDLLQNADAALYQAKRSGRNRAMSFEASRSVLVGGFVAARSFPRPADSS